MKVGLLLSFLMLFSCSKHHPAPVQDRQYSRAINSSHPLSKQNKFQSKYTHVRKGDTLYSIGFNYNIDFKTLAKINNIHSPYRIYPGQKLKLTADKKLSTTQPNVVKNKALLTKPKTQATNKEAVLSSQNNAVKIKPTQTVSQVKKIPEIQHTPVSNTRWIWPVSGKIISTFSQTDTSRKGIDIASNFSSDVYASNHGTVVYSGDGLRGYGELIIIKHSHDLLSAYAHNSKRLVKEGQTVKQGQVIAKTGKGTDGRPLLHFEIRIGGKPVNPLTYLPKK